jgi:hypothetical protein
VVVVVGILLLYGRREAAHEGDLVGHVQKGAIIVMVMRGRVLLLETAAPQGALPGTATAVGHGRETGRD